MVSPQVSSAYGQALQFSQDAPIMASLANNQAQLQQQAVARGDQMRLANAALGAESANQNQNRISLSQAANANREQNALDLSAQLQARSNENMLHANTQLIAQQRGAELAVWANGQELSQADQMQQQKLARAVNYAMNDENLGPVGQMTPDRMNVLTQIRTGLDPLNEKLKQAQIKQMDQHAQLYQAQLQQKQEEVKAMATVNAMTAEQRVFHQLDPDAQAELNSQDMTPWERDAKQKELMKTGRYQTFTIDPDGTLRQVKREGGGGTGVDKSMENEIKHFETEHKSWSSNVEAYQRAWSKERAAVDAQNIKEVAEGGVRRATDEELDAAADRRVRIPRPGPEPVPPSRRGQVNPVQAARNSDSPVSEEVKRQPQELYSREEVALSDRPDVPPEKKQEGFMLLQEAQQLMALHGSYQSMDAKTKERYDQLGRLYDLFKKSLPVVPPTPSAANIAGGMMGSAIRNFGTKPPATPAQSYQRDRRLEAK